MLQRLLRIFLFTATAFAVAGFSYVALRLMADPRPIDPAEVQVLAGAQRLATGGALYDAGPMPSDRPLLPGYPFAVSLLMRQMGPDLWLPRMLAMASTLIAALLVMMVVRIETASWTLAAAAVGIAVMGLGVLAGFPGAALPDALMLALVMVAFVILRFTKGWVAAIPAALLLAAATFVEHEAVWFLAAALLAVGPEGRPRFFAVLVTAAVAIGAGYAALSQALGPWFNFAATDGPFGALRFNILGALDFVGDQLLGKLGVPTLAAVMSFAMPTEPWRGKSGTWMWLGLAGFAAALASTQSRLANPEAMMPVVLALAVLGPVSMQRLTRHLSSWPGSSRLGGQGVVLAALALQFVVFLATVSWARWLPASAPEDESVTIRQIH